MIKILQKKINNSIIIKKINSLILNGFDENIKKMSDIKHLYLFYKIVEYFDNLHKILKTNKYEKRNC